MREGTFSPLSLFPGVSLKWGGGGGDATVEFSSRLRLRIINDTGEGGGGGSCILILLFSVERRWAGQVMGAISLTGTGAPWA